MPRNKMHASPLCLLAALLLLLGAAQTEVVMAQATTTTTNMTMPLNMTVTACEGQQVTLSGNIHIVTHVTTNPNGNLHIKEHSNYQNVSGVGQPTPFLYRGVSSNNTIFNNNAPQSEFTVVDQVLLLSQGLSDNLQVHVTMHFTINANGETTAVVEEVRVECNG